jgi:hypothetical protein
MMPLECIDMNERDKALALIYSLEERGIISFYSQGTTTCDLAYHSDQWYYGEDRDPTKDVVSPNEKDD